MRDIDTGTLNDTLPCMNYSLHNGEIRLEGLFYEEARYDVSNSLLMADSMAAGILSITRARESARFSGQGVSILDSL